MCENWDFQRNRPRKSRDLAAVWTFSCSPTSRQKTASASFVSGGMRNGETRWANSPGRWLTAREKKREKRKNRADSEFWQGPTCPTGLGADSYSTAPLQLWTGGKIRELWIVVMKLDDLHHLQKADRSKSEAPLAARIPRKSLRLFDSWQGMRWSLWVAVWIQLEQ